MAEPEPGNDGPDFRVLVVDDEVASREGLLQLLRAWGYEVVAAGDGEEAMVRVVGWEPALVITDLVMPGLDGLGLLQRLRQEVPAASVILLTGQGTIDSAVTAIKTGAYDYLEKPVDPDRLRLLLQRAGERIEAARELSILRRQLRDRGAFGRLVAGAASMREVVRQLELVAPTDATVLLTGESGTGKELVARTLHEHSGRRRAPFVAINCAAIPESLLESELFGFEKGAFTGAAARRTGYFELANSGTLFLDEVAEMQPGVQAKLLRVLQEGGLRRLGGAAEIRVDVRVVAATNQDPERATREGRLREDLYYRLNVFGISLPPLRERLEDLPELIRVFLDEFNPRHQRAVRGLDESAQAALFRYHWPGNVRELRNVLERAVILCSGDLLGLVHLPVQVAGHQPRPADEPGPAAAVPEIRVPVGTTVDDAERQLIIRTLAHAGNNKTRAAEVLGISLKTLHNKLHRYGRPSPGGDAHSPPHR